ncbi:FAD-linked oxidoreductase subF [Cladobotryum mycophilum]|uniref:FAD-linked oxidoreductase subF n=1 Tax=Cladobotryum mycophilum TaxID=491253 RepID=A0ABR0SBR8_9HYPO
MSQQPVRIIGAGIGGSTLGRCLLNYGIPVVLYEKMPSTPRHSYGVTLHASSYRPLLGILSMDEWTFRRHVAVDGSLGGSGNIEPKSIIYPGKIRSSTSFRAHRGRLEKLLREGLDVQWEHSLENVEETPSGMSLSPDTLFHILPYVAFNGKRRVKRSLFDSTYAPAFKGSNILEMKRDNVVLNVSFNEQQEDIVSMSWIFSRPVRGSSDPLHKPNRPISGATDIPEEFFQEIETLNKLYQPFTEIFDVEKLRMDRMLHWLMRTVLVKHQELRALADKGVFLMGDSVHSEPILGGEGANNAIIEGIELAKCISTSGPGGIPSCGVPFVAKNSTDWTQETTPYNLRLVFNPSAVVIPRSIQQIQAAVSCGIQNGVRVSAKSGGHSYGSFGYGGEDGHLVIELDRMNAVTLHENNTATIQSGARLGHAATELFKQGHRAIAHGACPGVGIGGHVLHGGYGRSARTHGLALDWVIGATVILADGSIVHCSATENEDLFWALRGAGSSFGIVAEFEFKTFEAPDHITPFTIKLSWNETQAAEGLKALQDFAMVAPKELNMALIMGATSRVVNGMYYGDRSGLDQAIQPLLDRLDAKLSKANTVGWIEGLEYFANGEKLDQSYPYNVHVTAYATSFMTHTLNESQIKSLASSVFTNINDPSAHHSWFFLLELHGNNSAVAAIDSSATAFVHRDKPLLFQLSDEVPGNKYPAEGFATLTRFRESVTDSIADGDWGMYVNQLDTQIDAETAQKLYWGGNLPRLRKLKAKFDPGDVFWNPQGIRGQNRRRAAKSALRI